VNQRLQTLNAEMKVLRANWNERARIKAAAAN